MSLNKLYCENKKNHQNKEIEKKTKPLTNYEIVTNWFYEIAKRFDTDTPDDFVKNKVNSIKTNLEKGWKSECIELLGYYDFKDNQELKLNLSQSEVIDVIDNSSVISYYFTKNKDLLNTHIKLNVIHDAVHPSLIGLALFGITKKIGYRIDLYFEGESKCNLM